MSSAGRLVSVVVPVYNAAEYVESSIESILTQDYPNIELILINDGSVDLSGEICENYAAKDSRVVYRYQNNSGVSATRNHALSIAAGDYIVFVDSDDQLKAGAIRAMVQALEAEDADLCICGYEIVMKDRVIPMPIGVESVAGTENIAKYFAAHYLEAIASSVWGKLYKRALLTAQFEATVTMGEDLLFNFYYMQNIKKVCTISDTLYLYNQQNVNSLANNYKMSYYDQDMYVARHWISWIEKYPDADLTNLYYRVSSAFFYCMQIACTKMDKSQRNAWLKEKSSQELLSAVAGSQHRYNPAQQLMFRLLRGRNYGLLSVVCKGYAALKQLRG
jgi:glycosyltransferase involved in cell wall biosynthesis